MRSELARDVETFAVAGVLRMRSPKRSALGADCGAWAGQIEGTEMSSLRLLLVQKVGNVVHGELSSESLYHVGNSEFSDPLYFDLNLNPSHCRQPPAPIANYELTLLQ